jgi:1-deoxy-D-xylulose-5-phosphate reductoisomerase
MKKRVAILGATGSIGKSALDVVRRGAGDFEPVLLTSHTNAAGLRELKKEFPGALLALSGPSEPASSDEKEEIAFLGAGGLLQAIAPLRRTSR